MLYLCIYHLTSKDYQILSCTNLPLSFESLQAYHIHSHHFDLVGHFVVLVLEILFQEPGSFQSQHVQDICCFVRLVIDVLFNVVIERSNVFLCVSSHIDCICVRIYMNFTMNHHNTSVFVISQTRVVPFLFHYYSSKPYWLLIWLRALKQYPINQIQLKCHLVSILCSYCSS